MIKLNPFWEEKPLSKRDKENYKKATGTNVEKLYMMKDDVWEKFIQIQMGVSKGKSNNQT